MNITDTRVRSILIAGVLSLSSYSAQGNSFYSFGDSLTDNGISVREFGAAIGNAPGRYPGADGKFTNGSTWAEVLPGLSGLAFSDTNGYAIGGAKSGYTGFDDALVGAPTGFLTQIEKFSSDVVSGKKSLSKNDLIGIWIGTNDIFDDASLAALDTYVNNIETGIRTLQALGAHNFVLIGSDDVSLLTDPSLAADPALEALSISAKTFNQQLLALNISNVNIYYFDVLNLLKNTVSDPAKYGFTHITSLDNCEANQCDTLSLAQQNTYLMKDSIHYTDRFERLIASYIANIINARNTLSVQSTMVGSAGNHFLQPLISRYDLRGIDIEARNQASPWTVFINGGVANGADHSQMPGPGLAPGKDTFKNNAISIGVDYRLSSEWTLGAALNYSDIESRQASKGGSNTALQMGQAAVMASFAAQRTFINMGLAYGAGQFDISRAGVFDNLAASPNANVLSAAVRAGRWFHFESVELAPVIGLDYWRSRISGYSEQGDSLLQMGVRGQQYEQLNASLGGQIGKRINSHGASVESLLRLTTEQVLTDSDRTLESFQRNAPNFNIKTPVNGTDERPFGRLSAQVDIHLPSGWGMNLNAMSTFGNRQDDRSIMASFSYDL